MVDVSSIPTFKSVISKHYFESLVSELNVPTSAALINVASRNIPEMAQIRKSMFNYCQCVCNGL